MFYPNIFKILHILAEVPVTTCSCERSISTLRRVKTYLRSSMTQNRFNGYVLLNIQNGMKINLNDVIDMLAIKYPKRLKMLDIMNND
ncbi:52 kDa repressor of the inhibitor of the protein kinase-like [Hydractinia symbiolongicarpus]|uniref:52 kDa repressor of the inhibitor of the protein kinase-like n=1 Tax=Hydractinia symbiolongicarpus TaxID=13093 RepID=UPI00254F3157|nr:52 kDa repressor of the inhibitor of the protein kinase-like [Hydractinia symbiolongicarpus]